MPSPLPRHLRSTFNLLTRAYGARIDDPDYFAVLAFLAEHMCEENIAIAVGACFGKDPTVVTNDLAKVRSTPQTEPAVLAVRARLHPAGLARWLEEE